MAIRSTLTKRAGKQARQEVAGWELCANLTAVCGDGWEAGFSAGAAHFVEISRFRDPTANFEKKFAKLWEGPTSTCCARLALVDAERLGFARGIR